MLTLPNFSKAQLKGLSTLLSDAGQVFLATLVIPFLFKPAGIDAFSSLFGFTLTLVSWFASIRLLEEVDTGE